MNYTNQNGGGTTLLKYQAIINPVNIKELRNNPYNLLNGIPTLNFGFIPVLCVFAFDVTTPPQDEVFIGNSSLIAIGGIQNVWNSISISSGQQTFVLQQANNATTQGQNTERDYQPFGNLTPGTNTFELYQNADDLSADYGGIFTLYYLDAPLY